MLGLFESGEKAAIFVFDKPSKSAFIGINEHFKGDHEVAAKLN